MTRRLALQLMLFCLLIAAALRLPNIIDVPPGLHFDEAANGILAGDIGLRGQRPVFITSYTGKEVFFFYIAGGLMRLLGESIFSLRLTAAFFGLLTIAATYWLGRTLLKDRRIAIVAAALLAVSFWHLLFSRLGFRAISQPLLQAITVAALYSGIRRQSWPWILIGGISLGLSAYTYLAARVFIIPLVLSLIPLLVGKNRSPGRWKQLLLFFGAAFVVLLPLLIFFVRQPEAFWVRIGQVSPEGASLASLVESYRLSLAMIFLNGDPYWRFNIPGQSIFNWLWGGLSILGLVYLLINLRKKDADWQRAAYLLLIIMPMFMLLPTALATGDIVPSNLRAIGLLPFLYYLPAIGFVYLLVIIWRYSQAILAKMGMPETMLMPIRQLFYEQGGLTRISVFLILIIGAISIYQSYFREWALRKDLFYDSDADLVATSNYLNDADLAGGSLFVSANHYRHPTVAFLAEQYDRIKWLPQSQAIVFPGEGEATYLFSHNSPLPDWAADYFPRTPNLTGSEGPDGEPTFSLYKLSGPVEISLPNVTNANFADQVTLLGYDIASMNEGEVLTLDLFWRVKDEPPTNLMPFVHIEDAWRHRWSQVESFAYPSEQWAPGDIIVQRVDLPLEPGMPPGTYRLRIGIFDPDSNSQLALIDDFGRFAGNGQIVEGIMLGAAAVPERLPIPPNPLNLAIAPNLALVGYELAQDRVAAGAPLSISIWWEASDSLEPMNYRLELVRPDSTGIVLANTSPVQGTYPFSDWMTPQFLIDHQTHKIPSRVPAGDYKLFLRLLDPADETLSTVDLGPVTIEAQEREFTPPKTDIPLAANFGDEVLLVGYDFAPSGQDGAHELTLVWQANADPAESYTVFVHVLDPDSICCVWQQDIPPKQGTYPTDRWVNGEVVIDKYLINLPADLPAGSYPIEIGLYLPETGTRLRVSMAGQRDNDALYLKPIQVD